MFHTYQVYTSPATPHTGRLHIPVGRDTGTYVPSLPLQYDDVATKPFAKNLKDVLTKMGRSRTIRKMP
jgi:hypothetical protein